MFDHPEFTVCDSCYRLARDDNFHNIYYCERGDYFVNVHPNGNRYVDKGFVEEALASPKRWKAYWWILALNAYSSEYIPTLRRSFKKYMVIQIKDRV